jgi:hypothetical protein
MLDWQRPNRLWRVWKPDSDKKAAKTLFTSDAETGEYSYDEREIISIKNDFSKLEKSLGH